jgi:hypothetical protein
LLPTPWVRGASGGAWFRQYLKSTLSGCLLEATACSVKVAEAMTPNPITVTPETTIDGRLACCRAARRVCSEQPRKAGPRMYNPHSTCAVHLPSWVLSTPLRAEERPNSRAEIAGGQDQHEQVSPGQSFAISVCAGEVPIRSERLQKAKSPGRLPSAFHPSFSVPARFGVGFFAPDLARRGRIGDGDGTKDAQPFPRAVPEDTASERGD